MSMPGRLPVDVQLEISDRLDPRTAALAALGGWPLSNPKKDEIARARLWGSIFRPDTDWTNVSRASIDEIVLIGRDQEYLLSARVVPREHGPLHFVLLGFPTLHFLATNLRAHRSIGGALSIPDFNIMLHFPDLPTPRSIWAGFRIIRMDFDDLWKIGTNQTYVTTFRKSHLAVVEFSPKIMEVDERRRFGLRDSRFGELPMMFCEIPLEHLTVVLIGDSRHSLARLVENKLYLLLLS